MKNSSSLVERRLRNLTLLVLNTPIYTTAIMDGEEEGTNIMDVEEEGTNKFTRFMWGLLSAAGGRN